MRDARRRIAKAHPHVKDRSSQDYDAHLVAQMVAQLGDGAEVLMKWLSLELGSEVDLEEVDRIFLEVMRAGEEEVKLDDLVSNA